MRTSAQSAAQQARLAAVCCALTLGACGAPPAANPSPEVRNACAGGASLLNPEAAPGIGGTGQMAMRPGIGGTGRAETLARPGIGGTGIVGVVTGFASICVNGLELHYNPATPVSVDGTPGTSRDLMVGQVVAVRASGPVNDSGAPLQAQQIAVRHAAVGPLTGIDAASGRFEVMGQGASALVREDLAHLQTGDWVRVSGHRLADGTIRASRVQGLERPLAQAQLSGPVTALRNDGLFVGKTAVRFSGRPAGIEIGQEIAVRGRWEQGHLRVNQAAPRPTRAELGRVDAVVMQGFVQAFDGRTLDLGYASATLAANVAIKGGTMESLRVDQAVQLRGRVTADQGILVYELSIGAGDAGRGRTASPGMARNGARAGSAGAGSAGSSGSSGSGSGGSGGGSGGGAGGR